MLSSMFSPTKHEDKKFALELVELIQLLVKINNTESLDLAEKFGDHYTELQEKISTHDYTKDDERYYQLEKLKPWQQFTQWAQMDKKE